MIREMIEDGPFGWLMLALLGSLPIILVMMALGIIAEGKEWDAFRLAHNCKVVGKMRGETFTTVGPAIGGNGGIAIGVGATSDKTGWACDDGVTYWR